VKVSLVPSSVSPGTGEPYQFLTSYLINDFVAIDAGSIGFYRDADFQARIKHVFLTHSHMDHVASLPILLENAYEASPECLWVHASEAVLDCLRRDVFNDRLWPDFVRLSDNQAPFLRLCPLAAGRPVQVDDLTVTPIEVDHVVPTFGYIVEDAHSAVVFATDTGPTDAIWQTADRIEKLRAVFLEATFPNSMSELAGISKHLTPALFAREVKKLRRPCRFFAVHLKPRHRTEVLQELNALGMSKLEIAEPGREYVFGR
jgi:ribonuclease BN (tRNA processing enzyme)